MVAQVVHCMILGAASLCHHGVPKTPWLSTSPCRPPACPAVSQAQGGTRCTGGPAWGWQPGALRSSACPGVEGCRGHRVSGQQTLAFVRPRVAQCGESGGLGRSRHWRLGLDWGRCRVPGFPCLGSGDNDGTCLPGLGTEPDMGQGHLCRGQGHNRATRRARATRAFERRRSSWVPTPAATHTTESLPTEQQD